MYLSKSDYLMGLDCVKALWLKKNRKELMPEYDEATQYIAVKYTDTPEKIIKGYTVYDIEIPEEIENV